MLQEKDLTYQKALELCTATELATKDISLLQQKPTEDVKHVHTAAGQHGRAVATKRKLSTSISTLCYRCGGDHSSDTCRFRTAECRFCKKIGHISKVCKTRLRQPQTARSGTGTGTGTSTKIKKHLHAVEQDSSPTPLELPPQPQAPQEGYTLFTTIGGESP